MNPLNKEQEKEHRGWTEEEIEQLMHENGVERFNFDEAYGEGADLWTDEEFEEFLTWLRESRRTGRERRSKFD